MSLPTDTPVPPVQIPLLSTDDDGSKPLPRAELRDPARTVRYMLAGNAYVTFQSEKTGVHLTYHVEAADQSSNPHARVSHFVKVLTAPDHYEYLGCVYESRHYRHGRKSRIGVDAKSEKAFAWVWSKLTAGHMPTTLEVFHEGRCGRCGRRLTTPKSIETGLGPECEKKMEGR